MSERAEEKELKDETIIAALLVKPTIREAAKECGITNKVMTGRLSNPVFRAKYDEARREVLMQATTYIQGITSQAIRKMYEIMVNDDFSPQTQLNAADAILRHAARMTEQVDIISQIAELKRMFSNA